MFETGNLCFTYHRSAKSKYCSAQIEGGFGLSQWCKSLYFFYEKIYKVILKGKTCPTNIHLKKTSTLLVAIRISAEKYGSHRHNF